jgi:hypothetical protein
MMTSTTSASLIFRMRARASALGTMLKEISRSKGAGSPLRLYSVFAQGSSRDIELQGSGHRFALRIESGSPVTRCRSRAICFELGSHSLANARRTTAGSFAMTVR